MELSDKGRLTMSAAEWQEFAALTFAPWMPRSLREFDAMVELGVARHLAENTEGIGAVHAIAVDHIRFGPEGEVNFPMDPRKFAYTRKYGAWPTDSQLAEFEAGREPTPLPTRALLSVVRSNAGGQS